MKKTMFIVGCLAALLAACSVNPWKAADGPDEKAYAVLGTYQVFQKQALKIASDTTLAPKLRLAVADADAAAVPILRLLDTALTNVQDARDALKAGKSTQEKVAIAIANLVDWTNKGRAAVDALKAAIANAKKVASTAAPNHFRIVRYA